MKHSNKRAERLLEAADGMTTEEAEKYLRYGPRMEKLIRRAYYWQAETLQESKPDDTTITGELLYMMHKLSKLNREG